MRRWATYIHQLPEWPGFTYTSLAAEIQPVYFNLGRLFERMERLGFDLRQEAHLTSLTTEVLRTSEIEGDFLNPLMVTSSAARLLGMDTAGLVGPDRRVEGVVEMMFGATENAAEPLTEERMFGWPRRLFPDAAGIRVGAWRNDASAPMRVVSGAVGRQRIHFVAPATDRLPHEMNEFLDWYNQPGDWVAKAAIAHLWFVTVHPLDDGNGRIARAIADMSLARTEHACQLFYSTSSEIMRKRKAYYHHLERTQRGSLDITGWMVWFIRTLVSAIEGAETVLEGVLQKGRIWESALLNERQKRALSHMVGSMVGSFEGKMTSSKWARIARCSQDTAARDIEALVKTAFLKRNGGGGRSTSYSLS